MFSRFRWNNKKKSLLDKYLIFITKDIAVELALDIISSNKLDYIIVFTIYTYINEKQNSHNDLIIKLLNRTIPICVKKELSISWVSKRIDNRRNGKVDKVKRKPKIKISNLTILYNTTFKAIIKPNILKVAKLWNYHPNTRVIQ